jgi:hypothetical protein
MEEEEEQEEEEEEEEDRNGNVLSYVHSSCNDTLGLLVD